MLVSTTIIESGLDIPQANTLIVERADALGLAQLYQIRGRVGRSDVAAHAYLFYPDAARADPGGARAARDARRPHRARRGFAIAMRDLEIRGAGDLLGAEQSGHVAALGFELYVEMLNEAVAELSGQRRVGRAAGARRRARRRLRPGRATSRRRRSRSTSTGGSRSSRTRTSCASSRRDRGPLRPAAGAGREPVRDPGGEAEARRLGADYLVFRGGRATVGPLVLGSDELRELRARVDTAVYTTAQARNFARDGRASSRRSIWSMLCLDARQAA